MKPQDTVDYFLKTAWQNVANKYNQIAAGHGITQALGYMLINIHEEGTVVSQLAAFTGVKSTSLSRMLSNMEQSGFIYREGDPDDKRSVRIFLTDFGKEKRNTAKQVVRKFNEFLNSHISETERLRLAETLKKINQLALDYADRS